MCRIHIFFILFVLGSLCLAAPASQTFSTIAIGAGVTDVQALVSIDVTFTAADQPVSALQFDVAYPDQVVSFSAALGEAGSNALKTLYSADLQPGSKRVLIAGMNRNRIGNGVIATFSVQVRPGTVPGVYPVAIVNLAASDDDGAAVGLLAATGSVVVPGEGVNAPAVTAVQNAASYDAAAVAPGEIVVIRGLSLAAQPGASLQITPAGLVAAWLGGTAVLFDGIPAPLVYTTPGQLSAVVPYEVNGQEQTAVQVEAQGIRSVAWMAKVARTSPGIFTVDASGTGQGAILNEDSTTNGVAHPAATGSLVSIFGTGEGQTDPAGVDGSLVAPDALRHPLLPVTVTIGGRGAEVVYAGSAGGALSGLLQVVARVPADVAPGDAVPVTLTIDRSSQAGVTMAVR